jgi:predicted DNA-binding transcriptional regulator YafY
VGSPTERVLRLAAFVRARPSADLTLGRMTLAVPGYPDAVRDEHGEILPKTAGWETVRKMLHRDLRDLEAQLGIVLTYDPERHRYNLEPPFFTDAERLALLSACATVDVEGMPSPAVGELGAAVDEQSRRAIVWVHRHVVTFQQSRRDRVAVRFSYRSKRRTLDPYAVGLRRNQWYVVGRDHEAGALRQFRLDRIDPEPALEVLETAFAIPDDFDALSALRLDPNDWGSDPHAVARVKVSLARLPAFQRDLGGVVVERGDDAAIVELSVRHRASFRVRVTAFGGDAVLLEPTELVDDLVAWLRATASEGPAR